MPAGGRTTEAGWKRIDPDIGNEGFDVGSLLLHSAF